MFILTSCAWVSELREQKDKTPAIIPIKTILKNLVHQESSGWHSIRGKVVKSHRGAIGLYQITRPALEDYNTFGRGLKYTMLDLRKLRVNKKVGTWYLDRYFRYYGRRGLNNADRAVLAINCFNMGHGNTEKGKIYYPYVSNIAPKYFIYFINRREITNQGTKIMKIKSLYPRKMNI